MKLISLSIKSFLALAAGLVLFASCNKDNLDPTPITPSVPSAPTLAELLNDAGFSVLKAAVIKAGMMDALADKKATYTLFAPNDAALAGLGINADVINALPADQVAAIVRYHIVGGQRITSAQFPNSFPNLQLPTSLVLAPPSPSVPPGLRMSVFPSKAVNLLWVNNVPVTAADVQASNGILHKIGGPLLPPSALLWTKIDTDPNLTYLKAAIKRADTGVPADSTLQAALSNPAANFTLLAPTNAAFQQGLTLLITQKLMQMGMTQAQALAQAQAWAATPDVFTNPALTPVFTPTVLKGLVAYHLLGTDPVVVNTKIVINGLRVFSVNIPTTPKQVKTYFNGSEPTLSHPGVTIQATFGATGVTAATVKGAVNTTASNILINPFPGGTSDQNYVNGVLHMIDQVLLPIPF